MRFVPVRYYSWWGRIRRIKPWLTPGLLLYSLINRSDSWQRWRRRYYYILLSSLLSLLLSFVAPSSFFILLQPSPLLLLFFFFVLLFFLLLFLHLALINFSLPLSFSLFYSPLLLHTVTWSPCSTLPQEEEEEIDSDLESQLQAALDADYTTPPPSLSPTPPPSPEEPSRVSLHTYVIYTYIHSALITISAWLCLLYVHFFSSFLFFSTM